MNKIPIRNLNNKRVCDITEDHRELTIRTKDCETVFTVSSNGTLKWIHRLIKNH